MDWCVDSECSESDGGGGLAALGSSSDWSENRAAVGVVLPKGYGLLTLRWEAETMLTVYKCGCSRRESIGVVVDV